MAQKPTLDIHNNLHLLQPDVDSLCSIQLGKNYVAYISSNLECSTVYALKYFALENKSISKAEFDDIFSDELVTRATALRIGIDTQKSLLAPQKILSDADTQSHLLALQYDVYSEEEIHTQVIDKDLVSIFTLKKATVEYLRNKCPHVQLVNTSACTIPAYKKFIVPEYEHTLFVSVLDDYATITAFTKHELCYHQGFTIETAADILYHVSNFIHQKQLEKSKIALHIHGENKITDYTYNLLEQYFSHTRYLTRDIHLQCPEGLYAQPSHHFFNLFAIATCAL